MYTSSTTLRILFSAFKVLLIVAGASLAVRFLRAFIGRTLEKLLAKTNKVNFKLKGLSASATLKLEKERIETIKKVFYSIIKLVIWVIALLTILPILGINIAPLLAGLGIGGLALGFGARNLVQDYISGLFILLEDQYRVGEIVEAAGIKGRVEDFNLRRTVLAEDNGVRHYIPNSQVKKAANFSRKELESGLEIEIKKENNKKENGDSENEEKNEGGSTERKTNEDAGEEKMQKEP